MRKLLILLAIGLSLQSAAQAQDVMNTAKNASKAASNAGFDVTNLTKGIMGKMIPTLALSGTQQSSVSSSITSFLTQKSGILSLKNSNPAAYATKFASLFGGLKSKLGGILTAAQMTKFLGMKPKTNDVTNVMSNLFY
jgi:beta-glucosidase-like glycosyl hydrolase